jgi:hypothetical protein
LRTPIAGIDITTGPAAVGRALGAVDGEPVTAGGVDDPAVAPDPGPDEPEPDGTAVGAPEPDGEVAGAAEPDEAEPDPVEPEARGELPDGAVSLHPASTSTTARTPTSLTPRR